MSTDNETEGKSDALMLIKDPERGNKIVSAEMQRAMTDLASDMGLDLRLGHLMVLGGRPYIGKAGIQYLLQKEGGVGIKEVQYKWIRDEWATQEFIVECILETNNGDIYRGEGDAVGVPLEELARMNEEARKAASSGGGFNRETYKARLRTSITDWPFKNVTTMIAQNLHVRRMAQTRAFNRAGSLAVKSTLPTSEEHVLVQEYTDAEYEVVEEEAPLASKEQVKKIMEFHKSSSKAIKALFEKRLPHGPPDTWTSEDATEFITRVAEVKEAERLKAKEERDAIEGKAKEAPPKEGEPEKAEDKPEGAKKAGRTVKIDEIE